MGWGAPRPETGSGSPLLADDAQVGHGQVGPVVIAERGRILGDAQPLQDHLVPTPEVGQGEFTVGQLHQRIGLATTNEKHDPFIA